MLQNQVYIGNMVQGRTEQSLFNGIKFQSIPKEDWVVVNNTHEPIIDKKLFDKVQILINETEIKYKARLDKRKPTTENPLRGILYCGLCNSRLSRRKAISTKNKTETISFIYTCNHKSTYGLCSFERIKEADILDAIVSTLQFQITEFSDLRKNVLALKKNPKFRSTKSKNGKAIKDINLRLSVIPKYKKSLLEDYLSKSISEAEYTSLSGTYNAEIIDLENRLV